MCHKHARARGLHGARGGGGAGGLPPLPPAPPPLPPPGSHRPRRAFPRARVVSDFTLSGEEATKCEFKVFKKHGLTALVCAKSKTNANIGASANRSG